MNPETMSEFEIDKAGNCIAGAWKCPGAINAIFFTKASGTIFPVCNTAIKNSDKDAQ